MLLASGFICYDFEAFSFDPKNEGYRYRSLKLNVVIEKIVKGNFQMILFVFFVEWSLSFEYDHEGLVFDLDTDTKTASFISTSLDEAKIPESIEYNSISYKTERIDIQNTQNFTSIYIPKTILKINNLSYCQNLKIVTIQDGITSLGESWFTSVTSAFNVDIPDSVEKIGNGCFENSGVRIVTYGPKLREIGMQSFINSNIISLKPRSENNIQIIKESCFAMCTSLSNISSLISKLSEIDVDVFDNCSKIEKTLNIPDSITKIGAAAFAYSSVEYIAYGSTLVSIGELAFAGSALVVFLPRENAQCNIVEVGDMCFHNCISLSSIGNLIDNINSFGKYAFSQCPSLNISINLNDNVEHIPTGLFRKSGIISLTFSSNLKNISDYAFTDSSIESLSPRSLCYIEYIGEYCFFNCTKLCDITKILTSLSVISTGTFQYCKSVSGKIVLPFSLVEIGERSFDHTGETEIYFNANLKKIGFAAFANSGIKLFLKIDVIDLEELGEAVFANCTSLKDIDDEYMDSMYYPRMFYGCKNLKRTFNIMRDIPEEMFAKTGKMTVTLSSDVKVIGPRAFMDSEIINITCESDTNLQKIEEYSFMNCRYLVLFQSVILDTVTDIGEGAFCQCTSLRGIDLRGIVTIGKEAFMYSSLEFIQLPNTLKKIESNAFSHCDRMFMMSFDCPKCDIDGFHNTSVTKIYFNAYNSIKDYAFANSYNLQEIIGLENGHEIGEYAFYKADLSKGMNFEFNEKFTLLGHTFASTSLNTIIMTVPTPIKLPGSIFENCNKLKSVELHINQFELPDFLFKDLPIEKFVVFTIDGFTGSSLKIGKSCFDGVTTFSKFYADVCINITVYTLELDDYSFASTGSFINFYVCSSEITIGNYAFSKSSINNFVNSYKGTTTVVVNSYAFSRSQFSKFLNADSKDAPITKAATCSFYMCNNMRSLPLVTRLMDTYSIYSCEDLQDVVVNASSVRSFSIFLCPSITSILIGNNVNFIGKHFFDSCKSVSTITFESGENELSINDEVFAYAQISKLSLNDRITNIGTRAFYYCTNLIGTLTLPIKIEEIGYSAFEGCKNFNGFLEMSHCTMLSEIGKRAFQGCSSFRGNLLLPDSLRSIGEHAFNGCHFTGSLEIPNAVLIINNKAFFECSSFTGNLIIGSSVFVIGEYAFWGCTGFDGNIEFRNNWTEYSSVIQKYAFYGCTRLSGRLILPKNLNIIESFAFYNCRSFSGRLVLPENLSYIGESAFALCSSLDDFLYIPKNTTYIGPNAFFKCTGLERIYFKSKNVDVGDKAFGNLQIKCLQNVPKNCSGSLGSSRCYDSNSFDKLAKGIGENCTFWLTVKVILWIISVVGSSTVILIGTLIFKSIISKSIDRRSRLTKRFEELIEVSFVKDADGLIDHNETAKKVVSRLNDFIRMEALTEDFRFSKKQTLELAMKSIKKKWPGISNTPIAYCKHELFIDIQFPSILKSKKKHKTGDVSEVSEMSVSLI